MRSAVRHASLACFFLCLAALSLRRVQDLDDWLDRMTWIFVAYLLLAAFQFNAWYATWLVPLAALARRPSPLLLVSSVVFLVYYLPIESSGRAALFFWPLVLLVLSRVPRLLRPAAAGGAVPEVPAGPDRPDSARDGTPRLPWPLRGKRRAVGADWQGEWRAPDGSGGVGRGQDPLAPSKHPGYRAAVAPPRQPPGGR